MAKLSYTKLGLKANKSVNTFKFNDQEIEVLKYLPIQDKNDLVAIALQKSEEKGIYNEVLLDMYFHLFLVYLYTNINFTDKQKEDEFKLYDILRSSGFLDAFLNALEDEEYDELHALIHQAKENDLRYKKTAAYVLSTFVNELPQNAAIASEILDKFNPEKFQQVMTLAKNTGMITQ